MASAIDKIHAEAWKAIERMVQAVATKNWDVNGDDPQSCEQVSHAHQGVILN